MRSLILVADGVEDLEFFYPYYRLKEQGIEVDVAGPKAGTFTGKHGYAVPASLSFAEVHGDDYDILILPGGKAPETIRQDPQAVALTRQMVNSGKLVAAICHGAQVLVSADVLEGRRATCYVGVRDDLKAAGARYLDQEVVVDGQLVTSRHPGDLPAFCREIFQALHAKV